MKNKKNVFWSGIFLLSGIILFLIMFFTLTNFRTKRHGYTIFVEYKFVAGLNVGAPVRLEGMQVGEVSDLELKNGFVIAKLWLKKAVKVPKTAVITINTLGLIGERYMEMDAFEQKPPYLKPNDVIRGQDPVQTARIYSQGVSVMASIKESMQLINRILRGPSFNKSLTNSMMQLSKFLDNLNTLLSQSSSDFRNTNKNLSLTMRNIKEISEVLKRKLPTTMDKINNASDSFAQLSGNMNRLLKNLNETTNNLNVILANIRQGNGSLGKFLNNDEFYRNLNDFSREIKAKPWLLLRKK